MPYKLKPSELKKYQYWREFLLRSNRYRKLCEFINTRKKTAPFDDELIYSWCPINDHLRKPYLDWLYRNINKDERNTKFDPTTTYDDILMGIYPLFQDVFKEPFSKVEHRVKLFYELNGWKAVECAKSTILGLLTDSFSKNRIHDSKLRHTKDIYLDFLDYLDGIYGGQLLDINKIVSINTRYPKQTIKDQFNKYLDTIFDKQVIAGGSPSIKPFFSSGNLNFSRFEDCLQAFDAKNGRSIEEAYKIIFPTATEREHETNLKTLKNRLKRADHYIQNSEHGIFPGYLKPSNKNSKNKPKLKPEYDKIAHLIEAKKKAKLARGLAKSYPLENYYPSKKEN